MPPLPGTGWAQRSRGHLVATCMGTQHVAALWSAPQGKPAGGGVVSGHDHLEHRLEGPKSELSLSGVGRSLQPGQKRFTSTCSSLPILLPTCGRLASQLRAQGGKLGRPAPVLQGFLPPPGGSCPDTGLRTARGAEGSPKLQKQRPRAGWQLPRAWVWRPSSGSPRPTGLPSHRAYPGRAPAHPAEPCRPPARAAPSARDSRLLRGSAVCLGKAEGGAVLAASVSGAGTGSSLTPAFAQEGDTRHVTSAIEKQRSGPPSCGPAGRHRGSSGGLPLPTDPRAPLRAGTHGLLFPGSCLTLLGLKGRHPDTWRLPTEP